MPIVPSSGLYIDALPFINITAADAAADADNNPSGLQLINNKIDEAKQFVAQDIYAYFSDKLKKESVIDNQVVGFYNDNLQQVLGNGNYRGINLRINNVPYTELLISYASLQLTADATVNIIVIDLMTGKQIDSFPIVAKANEIIRIDLNKTYSNLKQTRNLFIGYDTTGINSLKTTIYQQGLVNNSQGCTTCGDNGSSQFISIRSAELSTTGLFIYDNLKQVNDTGGLSITYSLNCNIEPYICSIKNLIAYPLRHRAAIEILREIKYSRRINNVTVVYAGDVEDLKAELEAEYTMSMSRIFQNLTLPDGICFKCDKRISKRVQVP